MDHYLAMLIDNSVDKAYSSLDQSEELVNRVQNMKAKFEAKSIVCMPPIR